MICILYLFINDSISTPASLTPPITSIILPSAFLSLLAYSIEGIVAFTTLPLSISTFFGILFSIMAFILIIIVVLRNLLYQDPVQGWTSTICIILLLGGIQLFSIGILGKYLEKTYLETKNRPIYIIKETNMMKL